MTTLPNDTLIIWKIGNGTYGSSGQQYENGKIVEEAALNEYLKALLNIGTAGVGSLIALFLKDRMDRGVNARKSDTEEFKRIQTLAPDALLETLSSPDFLAGMEKSRFSVQLNDLIHAYAGDRAIIFHNKDLNGLLRALLAAAEDFQMNVARSTVPEGEPTRVTTRPRADRVYPSEETERQSRAEALDLDRQSKALATQLRSFLDVAKRALNRLRKYRIPKSPKRSVQTLLVKTPQL